VIETNRSSFWAKNRTAVTALVLFSLLALLIGCGGGGGGGGSTTSVTDGSTTGSVPDAPTNLVAVAGDGQVNLTWDASANAVNYSVFRASSAGGSFTDIQDGISTTSFNAQGLTNGTTYFFKVRAHNGNGFSGDSATKSATPTHVVIGPTWLPGNTIFYTAADGSDATATDLRTVTPLGTGDALFTLIPNQYIAAAPNPNVTNQYVFAYTTDVVPTGSTVYSLYKNTSVSILGAVKLTDSSANGFNQVGSIGFTLDGQKIFFTAKVGATHGLYFMDPGGTNLTQVAVADDASLSPDGSKILISQSQGGQNDLFYVTVSDKSLHPVLQTTTQDEIMPQWSKDGSKITFAAESATSGTPNFDVFTMPFPSGGVIQLTANGDDNFSPSFGPDGTQVAFTRVSSSNVANSGVYRAPSGGGSSTLVIANPSVSTSLYWTSNSGRAVGGSAALTIGRSLKDLHRIR
jgi:hypothetical protein